MPTMRSLPTSTPRPTKSSPVHSPGRRRGKRPREQRREIATGRVPGTPTETPERRVKVLCSYFYFADEDLDALVEAFAPHPVEIMADSGGFSAWSLGKDISLQDYNDWCHRWRHRLHAYAALDDLLSSQITAENFAEMQRQGL